MSQVPLVPNKQPPSPNPVSVDNDESSVSTIANAPQQQNVPTPPPGRPLNPPGPQNQQQLRPQGQPYPQQPGGYTQQQQHPQQGQRPPQQPGQYNQQQQQPHPQQQQQQPYPQQQQQQSHPQQQYPPPQPGTQPRQQGQQPPPSGTQQPGQPPHGGPGRSSNTQQQPQVYVANPCCCDCALHEGVAWIASLEFIWGIIFAIACTSLTISHQNATQRLRQGTSSDEAKDWQWMNYGRRHNTALIITLCLHIGEILVSMMLMVASSRRNRGMCFFWMISIALISIAEVAIAIYDAFNITYISVGIIPFRFYFAYIVWALANEIEVYPRGPPVRVAVRQVNQTVVGGTVISPVVVPSYGYGYQPYYGYGYGYPYGYAYDADLALAAGVGLGVGLGGYGYGGYGGYDVGYGGGYYDSDFGGGGYYDSGGYDSGGGYYDSDF